MVTFPLLITTLLNSNPVAQGSLQDNKNSLTVQYFDISYDSRLIKYKKKYVDTGSLRVDAEVKPKYSRIYTNVRPPVCNLLS